jgi:hypothetical protein
MPRMLIVKEIAMPECRHVRYFKFPIDPGSDFNYRSRTSINAFFHSTKQRNYKPTVAKAQFLYHSSHEEEYLRMKQVEIESFGEDIHAHVPMTELPDIWAFYQLIGWEHKTKTWRVER